MNWNGPYENGKSLQEYSSVSLVCGGLKDTLNKGKILYSECQQHLLRLQQLLQEQGVDLQQSTHHGHMDEGIHGGGHVNQTGCNLRATSSHMQADTKVRRFLILRHQMSNLGSNVMRQISDLSLDPLFCLSSRSSQATKEET